MPEEITIEDEIKKLLERKPFVPFYISLTSGERYEVTERHQLAIGSGSTVALIHPREGITILRKNQIVAVDAPERAQ